MAPSSPKLCLPSLCVRSWDTQVILSSCTDESERLEETYDVEVRQVLGAGGFGIVRKATQKTTNKVHAVKTVKKIDPKSDALARNEIDILGQLNHPCICPLIDKFEDAAHIHLVLEYIDGHDLFEEITKHRVLDEARAAGIMQQVFSALQHCHKQNIIHRDVKSENIMIYRSECYTVVGHSTKPKVKLIDFGLATWYHHEEESASSSCLMGSFEYLAPEARRGYASPASDVFSAGMILHLLLTGFLPKQDDIDTGRHLVEVGSWNAASAGAKDLVSRVLKTASNERITAEEAAEHNWSQNIVLASHTRKNINDQKPICKSHFNLDEDAQTSAPGAMALELVSMLPVWGDLQNSVFKAIGSLLQNGLHYENTSIAEKELNNLVIDIMFSTSECMGSRIRTLLDAARIESTEWITAKIVNSMYWLDEAVNRS